jgi:hypothetical protein
MLLFPIIWGLIGVGMLWRGWRFEVWPFVVVPVLAWIVLVALPMFWKMRNATMSALDAMIRTSEAYLARAGYVIDINQDGAIGYAKPEIKPPEEVRPIIYRGRTAYTDVAPRVVGGEELGDFENESGMRLWHLPNGEKIRQDHLEDFVDGIFIRGHTRDDWPSMERKVYDGCMLFLGEAGIVTGRGKGTPGKRVVDTPQQARRILNLPPPG